MGLGSGSNANGLQDVAADVRFTRPKDGPPLVLPPALFWCSIESKEWRQRFLVQKCSSCKFVEGSRELTGYPEAALEKVKSDNNGIVGAFSMLSRGAVLLLCCPCCYLRVEVIIRGAI